MKTAEQLVDEIIEKVGAFQQLPEGLRVPFRDCLVTIAGLALLELADAAAETAMQCAEADEADGDEYNEGRYDAAVDIAETIMLSVKEGRAAMEEMRAKYRGRVQ